MRFFRFIATTLAALFFMSATGPALAAKMLDLPVNTRTLAAGYVYCLTNDRAAATDLLAQRIEYAGGNPDDAAGWIASGYCRQFLAAADRAVPLLLPSVQKLLNQVGFNPDEPITSQAKKGKKGKKKLGEVIKSIGRTLGKVFGGAGGGGRGTYIEYSNPETGEYFRYCDRSWEVNIGKFDNGFGPTPYWP